MKVSAVNVHSATNFKGLLLKKSESSHDYGYNGESCDNKTNRCMGSEDYEDFVYYPFINESKNYIKKCLDTNNYEISFSPDETGGYDLTYIRSTKLGKTLPFTESEWKNYSEDVKNKFLSML